MKQILNSNTYPDFPNFEINYHKKVELFLDSFLGLDINKDSFKILYVKEAEVISRFRQQAIQHSKFFDVIITYDEEILKKCDNSCFFPFGTSWIHDYDFPEKKFQVSHLTGHKMMTEGHRLRQKIHYKQDLIKIQKDFYISKFGGVENLLNNKILADSKTPLFDSKFHICIENSREKNYFTEKIVDCFITKTIPIYWGCTNIGDFFDTEGFFIVNNFDEIINCCNNLNDELYEKKLEIIEKNFNLALGYADLNKNLKKKIEQILKTKHEYIPTNNK